MQIIRIKEGSVEIRERAVILIINEIKQILQLLQTDNNGDYVDYSCLNIETDELISVKVYTNQVITITNISREELLLQTKQIIETPATVTIDVNIDHSKTINTVVESVRPIGKALRKLIIVSAVIGLAIFAIYTIDYFYSEHQDQIRESEKKQLFHDSTTFNDANFTGVFQIEQVTRNNMILIYDPVNAQFGKKAVYYVDNPYAKIIIRGKVSISAESIIEYIDYNNDAIYSGNESIRYSVVSISNERNNYNVGFFDTSRNVRFVLVFIDQYNAELAYQSGNDWVVYKLKR